MEPHNHLTSPPEWSLLVGSAGRGFILLAIILLAFAAVGWLLSPKHESLAKYAARSFTFGCVSLFSAFASLALLFVNNRFEFVYVSDHADSQNTIPYRIAGIWAGQEGSFLLWACGAAVFGLLAVRGTGIYRRWFTVAYAGFLAAIASILAYETPFGLLMSGGKPFVPEDGVGLSPSLQNYWVIIHPPTIFLGFGALTVLAAYGFAALATNKMQEWVAMVRPWAIVALTFVGVGLCMGGFWAYETLGWGGFWMWDPVENVSFVPWVFTAALVHGLMVQATKKKWVISNLLMAGLPFVFFAYGTFLTRSGLLSETSVHSFANMDRSALKLLGGFLAISTFTYIGMVIWRGIRFKKENAPQAEPAGPKGLHREGLFRFGSWLLAGLGIAAALGMSWPAIMAISGKASKVVEEPLYHSTLSWLYVPLMLAMAIAPMVAWRGMGAKELANRLFGVVCVTVAIVGLIMMAAARSPWIQGLGKDAYIKMPFGIHVPALIWVLILASLSVLVIVANGWRISELVKRSKLSAAAFLTHVGVAVLMAGLITSRGLERKEQFQVQEGNHAVALGYFVSVDKMTSDVYDRNNKVLFNMVRGNERWTASPGLYYVPAEDGQSRAMVWPHIESTPFYDIYFALQPPTTDLSTPIQIKPGETKELNGATVTFEKLVQQGTPGTEGMKWGAQLKFVSGQAVKTVTPALELTDHGTIDHSAEVDPDVRVSLLAMNAGTNAVTIQLLSARPIYPVEMFYKPLTILVWVGTGIMAIAGLLSAFYRRMPRTLKSKVEADPEPAPQPEAAKKPGTKAAAVGAQVH